VDKIKLNIYQNSQKLNIYQNNKKSILIWQIRSNLAYENKLKITPEEKFNEGL